MTDIPEDEMRGLKESLVSRESNLKNSKQVVSELLVKNPLSIVADPMIKLVDAAGGFDKESKEQRRAVRLFTTAAKILADCASMHYRNAALVREGRDVVAWLEDQDLSQPKERDILGEQSRIRTKVYQGLCKRYAQ